MARLVIVPGGGGRAGKGGHSANCRQQCLSELKMTFPPHLISEAKPDVYKMLSRQFFWWSLCETLSWFRSVVDVDIMFLCCYQHDVTERKKYFKIPKL